MKKNEKKIVVRVTTEEMKLLKMSREKRRKKFIRRRKVLRLIRKLSTLLTWQRLCGMGMLVASILVSKTELFAGDGEMLFCLFMMELFSIFMVLAKKEVWV